MRIQQRRYTGNKYKLMPWIKELVLNHCTNCNSFFDVFAGTGVVTAEFIDIYERFVINDFLYSNNIIYNAFFLKKRYSKKKLDKIKNTYNNLDADNLDGNYVSTNYGDKYFSFNDAKLIGYIREDIEKRKKNKSINNKEFAILVASLLYSFDRISNTVGHYEAYIKNSSIRDSFVFDLIEPIDVNGVVEIYREDSNKLARRINCDIAFIDPPYNSRQYSRFYHVLETIVKWDSPELFGTAMKPKEENMSDYCRNSAPNAFSDLIDNLNTRYIVVTYNNTYTSKSSSSKNKITLEQIEEILQRRGNTMVFEHDYNAFNAGKTELNNHKELLFITEVNDEH